LAHVIQTDFKTNALIYKFYMPILYSGILYKTLMLCLPWNLRL